MDEQGVKRKNALSGPDRSASSVLNVPFHLAPERRRLARGADQD